jgi:hypothetical protein
MKISLSISSIRLRVILVTLLVALVPVCTMTVAGLLVSMQQTASALSLQSRTALDKVSAAISRTTREAENVSRLVAGFNTLQGNPEPDSLRDMLFSRQHFWDKGFVEVFDAQGRILARSVPLRTANRQWMTPPEDPLVMQGILLHTASDIVRTPAGLAARAVAPVYRPSSLQAIGAVVTTFPLDRSMLQHIKEQTQADITLHYPDLRVESTLHDASKLPVTHDWDNTYDVMRNAEGPAQYEAQIAGSTYALSSIPLRNNAGVTQAVLSVALNRNMLRQYLHDAVQTLVLTLVLALVMAAGLGMWTAEKLTRPLHEMVQAIRRMAGGNLSVRVSEGGSDELGELAQSFNKMAGRLEEQRAHLLDALHEHEETTLRLANANKGLEYANRELLSAREEYRKIFEGSVQGIYQTTLEGRFIKANRALARMLGYGSAEELIGTVTDIGSQLYVNPADRQRLKSLLSTRSSLSDFETRFYRRDGSQVPVSISVRLVYDENDLPQYLEGALTDITERERRREAEQQREAAEAASKAKSEFLARMSHEVRTPLNAVVGMADLLWESDLTPDQRLYVDIFRKSGQTLLALLNDILDYSRLEAGRLTLERLPFSLRDTLTMTVNMHAAQAESRQLSLSLHVDETLPDNYCGDSLRLRQILGNLLSNSIKFTREGSVEVHVGPAPGQQELTAGEPVMVRICVRDTGIGIPENVQQTIFESFTQADSSITRQFGGTGLGLSICRMLTTMMGGRIWLESTQGQGTAVYVEMRLDLHDRSAAETQPEECAMPVQAAPLRILCVEDSANNRLLFRMYLKNTGHEVDEAENGEEGLRLFMLNSYDIIFMDLEMPVMDGYMATTAIRDYEQRHRMPAVPVVALTAHALEDFKQRCLAMGFTDYLTKPFRKQQLLAMLERNTGAPAPQYQADGAKLPAPEEHTAGQNAEKLAEQTAGKQATGEQTAEEQAARKQTSGKQPPAAAQHTTEHMTDRQADKSATTVATDRQAEQTSGQPPAGAAGDTATTGQSGEGTAAADAAQEVTMLENQRTGHTVIPQTGRQQTEGTADNDDTEPHREARKTQREPSQSPAHKT